MCNCSNNNPCGCANAPELPYITGATGSNGQYGGWSSKWNFTTNTASVGSTYLGFDSATYSAVSAVRISDTNADSVDCDTFLDSFSNSSNYGLIRIFKEFDSTKFWLGIVTSVTDLGSAHTLGVTYVTHNGSFAADDDVVITFTPYGAAGSSSATKAYIKESFIGNNTYYETKNSTGVFTTDLTTASNELDTNGDTLLASIAIRQPDNLVNRIRFVVGGTALDTFSINGGKAIINAEFTRQSATQLHYVIQIDDIYSNNSQDNYFYEGFVTVADLSANAFDTEIEIVTLGSANLDLYKMQSKYILV